MAIGIALAAFPQAVLAQAAAAAPEAEATGYVPMKPVPGIGQPIDGAIGFQQQFSPTGHYALWMHDAILMPVITIISVFVLFLLIFVSARFRSAKNPVASRTSHNTLIEVIWTGVPVLILSALANHYRLQTTGADVIHSFAVPSLWFKLDAVPGRVNEKVLFIEKPGVYYGQCSELCGARHGYMPIAVEALPRDKFNAWVRSQGGTVGAAKAAAPAAAPAAPAAPAPAAETATAEASAPADSASAPAA